mgnify:FL=1
MNERLPSHIGNIFLDPRREKPRGSIYTKRNRILIVLLLLIVFFPTFGLVEGETKKLQSLAQIKK